MFKSLISLLLCGLLAASPALGLSYSRFNPSMISKPYSYRVIRPVDGPVRVQGVPVERFEVRPGDCSANADWDDCANDRERAEMSESKKTQNPYNSEGWYTFSLFLPSRLPSIYPTKSAFGQFHMRGGQEPAVQFDLGVTDEGFVGLYVDMTQTRGGRFPLVTGKDLLGRWQDILIHARWSAGADGFFHVYVNGELRVRHEGRNLLQPGETYFKYGIYRSYVSRYANAYHRPPPTQIAFYSWIKKGTTREEVEQPR